MISKYAKLFALTLSAAFSLDAAALSLEAIPFTNPDGSAAPARIFLDGELNQGIAAQLARALARNNIEHGTIYLNSAGGDLQGAIELGELIRKVGFNTAVGKRAGSSVAAGNCNSACLVVLAGGVFRYADDRSHIGIHRFYSNETRSTDLATGQIISASLTAYFNRMGVDVSIFERMVGAGAAIRKLSIDESERLRLLNQGRLAPSWAIQGKGGRVFLEGIQITDVGAAKLQISCDRGTGLNLNSEFKPRSYNPTLSSISGTALVVDGSYLPSTGAVSPYSSGALSANYAVGPNHASQIKTARELGYAWISNGSEPVQFSIPMNAHRELVSSFISHCQGR